MRCVGILGVVLSSTAMFGVAQAAHAATLSKVGGELRLIAADGDTSSHNTWLYRCSPSVRGDVCSQESITFEEVGGDPIVEATGAEDPGCTENTGFGSSIFNCPVAGFSSIRVFQAGGNDQFVEQTSYSASAISIPVTLLGGDGNDNLQGTGTGDAIDGGAGADTINGRAGADSLNGGIGADVIQGGDGVDAVTYAGRADNVTVNLGTSGTDDGGTQDGAAGARDNVNSSDIEKVVGGSGDDEINGNGILSPLTFDGGPGADTLRAALGPATLIGAEGNDQLFGGNANDSLDGGSGGDTLLPDDGNDTVSAGTGVDSISSQDGVVDSIDCGGNKDSLLVDLVDTLAQCEDPIAPAPPADSSPASGGSTSPSSGSTLLEKLAPGLGFGFRATSGGTRLKKLRLTKIAGGATVSATCRTKRGRKCRGTKDYKRSNAPGTLRLSTFEGKALPVGARLTLRVVKPGMIGSVKVLTVRKDKRPSVKTLCLPPGANKPGAC